MNNFSLEHLIAAEVRAAVHAALDEREMNAWPQLMTLQQIEDRYTRDGVKVLKAHTLRAAILSNQLDAKKPGKEYLVSPEALRAYLELTSTKPQSASGEGAHAASGEGAPAASAVKALGTRPR